MVSGSQHEVTMLLRRRSSMTLGQRVSRRTSGITSGCWCKKTHPEGDSSGASSSWGASTGAPVAVSRMCRRMVLVLGSCSTRFRKSKRRMERSRMERSRKSPARSRCWRMALRDVEKRLVGEGFQLKPV